MDRSSLSGIFPAIVTPFSADGRSIDFKSLANLIEFQLDSAVHGLVVCGSTGEAMTLSDQEYSEVLKEAVRYVKGRCPVIAGVGSNNTAKAVEIGENAKIAGVDGLLVVVPYYNKPSQQGIFEHIKAVSQSSKLPVLAYNIPGRSVANLLPETVARLVDANLIVGIKESSGSLEQLLDLLALVRNKIAVLIGECSMVHAALASGCVGTISATANIIPSKFVDIFKANQKGDYLRAREIQFEVLPIVRAMFSETNPVPVKSALHLAGIIESPAVRLPLLSAQAATLDRIRSLGLSKVRD